MGRPSKLTPGLQTALCSVLAAGGTRRAACAYVGVNHTQLYRWLERSAPFRTAVEKAEADAELRFTAIVASAATDSWQAAAWWLERRRSDDYARRERVEVDVQARAAQLAETYGLDPRAVLAEAMRWLGQT